jgi:S-adenosylmethionine hydrolase
MLRRLIAASVLLTSPLSAQSPLVLQTVFGLADGSVAAMKGVALGIDPHLVIHDLTHQIPPYDIREAALRLRQTIPWWPAGTVFVSVVDPGVGTERRAVVARTKSGHYIVTPDNGTLTWVADFIGIEAIRIIDSSRHRLRGSEQSHTFHGRDLFVVVGARLAAGQITLNEVGPPADPVIVRLNLAAASRLSDGVRATVIGIDRPFGNVWTNAGPGLLDSAKVTPSDSVSVTVRRGVRTLFHGTIPFAATFGAVAKGKPLAYLNSLLDFALALNQGDFAARYQIAPGDVVEVRRR